MKIEKLIRLLRIKTNISKVKSKKKTFQFNLQDIYSFFIFILLIFPFYIAAYENFNFYTHHKIVNSDYERTIYSAFSIEEYNAAIWLYENMDRNKMYLSADPGSNYFLYGISGIPYIDYGVNIQNYKVLFLSCGEQGLDIRFFKRLDNYNYTDIILILTPRFHKWLQLNSTRERGIANPEWINQTLLEYIENTPSITKIYNNSEVYIYKFL